MVFLRSSRRPRQGCPGTYIDPGWTALPAVPPEEPAGPLLNSEMILEDVGDVGDEHDELTIYINLYQFTTCKLYLESGKMQKQPGKIVNKINKSENTPNINR